MAIMVTTRKRKKGEDSDFSDFDSPRPKKSIPIRGGKLTKKQKKAEEEGKEEKRQEVLEAMQLAKGRFQRLKLKVHTHDEKIDLIENRFVHLSKLVYHTNPPYLC